MHTRSIALALLLATGCASNATADEVPAGERVIYDIDCSAHVRDRLYATTFDFVWMARGDKVSDDWESYCEITASNSDGTMTYRGMARPDLLKPWTLGCVLEMPDPGAAQAQQRQVAFMGNEDSTETAVVWWGLNVELDCDVTTEPAR